MNGIYDFGHAFDALKEDVVVVQQRGARVIRSTARAVVVVGSGLSSAAGSQVSTETAARYSVSIEKNDFDFAEAPEFGDAIYTETFGKLTVKLVTESEDGWSIRCTRDMMGGLPS